MGFLTAAYPVMLTYVSINTHLLKINSSITPAVLTTKDTAQTTQTIYLSQYAAAAEALSEKVQAWLVEDNPDYQKMILL